MSPAEIVILLIVAFPAQVRAEKQLDFGAKGLQIPPLVTRTAVTPRDVELTRQALTQEADEVRRSCLLRDLVELDPDAAVAIVLASAGDDSQLMRATATRLLSRLPSSTGREEAIMRSLRDDDPEVRCAAASTAGELGDAKAVTAALADRDVMVIRAVLLSCRDPDSAKSIAAAYELLPQGLKSTALDSLARCGESGVEGVVLKAMEGSGSEQIAAIRAASQLRLKGASEILRRQISRENPPFVRRGLIRACSALLPPDEARGHALAGLGDADLTVRTAAAECLAGLPNPVALQPLLDQLGQPSPALRQAIRHAIVAIGPAAAPRVADLLHDPSSDRRVDGSWILGELASTEELQRHIVLLHDTNWAVAAQAAGALGKIGDRSAAPTIHALLLRASPLTAENAYAAQQAIIACARLKYRQALPSITPFLANSDPGTRPIRAAAAWSFGVLGDASDLTTCNQLLGLLNDIYEVEEVKFEALKALGNLKYAPSVPSLEIWAGGEDLGRSASLRWISHWALQQITGKAGAYEPPMRIVRPETMLRDHPASAS